MPSLLPRRRVSPWSYPGAAVADLETIAGLTLAAYHRLPHQPQLLLEPGRRLVATAVQLVTSVVARINRRERAWLYLDAGVYNALFEALACQGTTRYSVRSPLSVGSTNCPPLHRAAPRQCRGPLNR